jgi:hypothetical protein
VTRLLGDQPHNLSEHDVDVLVERTHGYSGSDMNYLCKVCGSAASASIALITYFVQEAALGPMRSIRDIRNVSLDQVQ